MNDVKLIGLDFGTTTSSAVAATARLVHNAVTGRTELSDLVESFRSPMTLTPSHNDLIDEVRINALLDEWLAACGEPLFGGGALLTGLAAQASNAAKLIAMIRERIGEAVVARADDPRLESWLAFMGSCAKLSRQHPDRHVINLDIGGGTTNIARGISGEVCATGCYFIGARHVQVVPGTYQIVKLSPYARSLFNHLGIEKGEDDEMTRHDVDRLLDCYLEWLIAAVTGDESVFEEPTARLHQQAAFPPLPGFAGRGRVERQTLPQPLPQREGRKKEIVVVTLSGGVGELVYAAVQDRGFPETTAFGDLGIDFAKHLLTHAPWADDFRTFIPEGGGRATSFGLLRHSTQISGSTLFLADPVILPLRDVPILGTIDASLPPQQWQTILQLLTRISGCVQIRIIDHSARAVRLLGAAIAESLRTIDLKQPLIVLVPGNVGKALGHYITQWGTRPLALVVIDEVPLSDARFVHLGRLHDRIVPVSFYGLDA